MILFSVSDVSACTDVIPVKAYRDSLLLVIIII